MNELQLRKDIIAGFELIIEKFCKGCKLSTCLFCNYRIAARAGHLNMLKKWAEKEDEKRAENL